MTDDFTGKVAFITGGARGFGQAFARALCARGAAVVLADVDGQAAEAAAALLQEAGHRAMAVACDVADEAAAAASADQAARAFGGIDILINNAGLHSARYNQSFQALGHAEVRRCLDVNVQGVINCSLACRPSMAVRGGGTIVNISSISAFSTYSVYGVSKLAVRGLTVAFAHEFAPDRIRVNAIAPGLIATETIRAELPAATFENFAANLQKIHRTGEVEDVVQAMLFLASDRASFITGETLKVSGGYPMTI